MPFFRTSKFEHLTLNVELRNPDLSGWILIIKLTYSIEIPTPVVRLLMWAIQRYRRLRHGRAYMRIRLTQNAYALVDPQDYIALSRHRWRLKRTNHTGYAVRAVSVNGKKRTIYMHRKIMTPPPGMLIDHINHNGLDNRRANLRFATPQQNNWNNNRKKAKGSRFRGVTKDKRTNKWRAVICKNNKRIHLGYFDTDISAARAYDTEARKLRGDFAVLNLPHF